MLFEPDVSDCPEEDKSIVHGWDNRRQNLGELSSIKWELGRDYPPGSLLVASPLHH